MNGYKKLLLVLFLFKIFDIYVVVFVWEKKKRVDIKKKIIKFEKVFIRVFICIFNKGRNEKMFFFFDLFIVRFLSI